MIMLYYFFCIDRRGSDMAVIYSLAFSADSSWLAVASDKVGFKMV